MAKFYGRIGFTSKPEEGTDEHEGIVQDNRIEERMYKGDVISYTRKWESGHDVNDDLQIDNQISIVADSYAFEHFYALRYVCWMGSRWKITNAKPQRPRILLTIGGLYNGPTP